MRRWFGPLAATATTCALLSGCGLFGGGDDKAASTVGRMQYHGETETVQFADGAGLYLPPTIAGYARVQANEAAKGRDIEAEYRRGDGAGETLATIRLRPHSVSSVLVPFSGTGKVATVAASQQASSEMVATLLRTDPGLAAGPSRNVYLLRFGVLQAGTQTVLQGSSGQRVVEAFCCVDGTWLYGFALAVPEGADPAGTADAFVRAVAWSADPKNSVESIEQQ